MRTQRQVLMFALLGAFAVRPANGQQRPCAAPPSCGPLAPRAIPPAVQLTWRSGVPDARADGAIASSVGANFVAAIGVEGAARGFAFRFMPEVTYASDDDHPTFGAGDPSRHAASSPFYSGMHSADLPSRRPGERPRVWFGESGVWWTGSRASLAVLTGQSRWGPAPGEGLVLGRSAPGVPRLEASLVHRVTPSTSARLRWLGGAVRESGYFDSDGANDSRALTGLRAEIERAGPMPIVLGLSRTVMTGQRGRRLVAAMLDPLRPTSSDSVIEMLAGDIVLSSPSSGTLAWLEGIRQEPVRSAGELLRSPMEGLAFRFGVTQVVRTGPGGRWTASAEFVVLDQAEQRNDRELNDLYTSRTVVQGWTHDGQPLGSGLGPGGQRQVASLDRHGRTWRLGGFLERSRRGEDAMLRDIDAASDRHDVQLQGGMRVARRWAGYEVRGAVSAGQRLNYLFQGVSNSADGRAVDIRVMEISIEVRPLRGEPVR